MGISDWSSGVCSADLTRSPGAERRRAREGTRMSDDTPPIRSIEEVHGCYRTGTGCGVGNWSETRVHASSRGGGGYLHTGSRHDSAPTFSVSSPSNDVLRFFQENEDEYEEAVTKQG